jgi:site-specific DNA recombinase
MAADSLLRAAIYCRMSTDKQEDSIERQMANVRPYADRQGYLTSDELTFIDKGIAGDEFEKRPGLQRLLTGAAAGRFDVLLCDEISRLSRQKFTEFMAKVAHPLEEAKVTVDSVTEGPLGWNEIGDLVRLTVHQSGASDESKKNSRRVLTEMVLKARQGKLLGGPTTFGYAVEYQTVEVPGKPPKVVPVRLVPDGIKAEIVTWIFQQYDAGATLCEIVQALARRCRAPQGGRWGRATVTRILKNPRYTGCMVWNQCTSAKYHSLVGGLPAQLGRRRHGHDRADWILVEGTHEPLVSREVFDRVQARLAGNRNGRDRSKRGGYVLSGLLQCGHCGRTLYGCTRGGRVLYVCQPRDQTGRRVCCRYRLEQSQVVRMLARVLQRMFLDPKHLAKLRAEIVRQEKAERAPKNLNGIRARMAELAKRIEQGRENLALLPADMVPGVVETVRTWEREREKLTAELSDAQKGGKAEAFDAVVGHAETALWRLQELADGADPTLLRATLREMVARVVFNWKTVTTPSGAEQHRVAGGVIHFLPDGLLDVSDVSCTAGRTIRPGGRVPSPGGSG